LFENFAILFVSAKKNILKKTYILRVFIALLNILHAFKTKNC